EAAAGHFEAEQRKPILEPIERDEAAVPRRRLAPAEVALHSEEAERIEPRDHDLPLRADGAVHLAEQLVRLARELERVRQHDEVERVLRKRQPVRIGANVRGSLRVDGPVRRDAALRKKRALRQADLDRLEAEDVGDGTVEPRLLARQQVAPERSLEPLRERRRNRDRRSERGVHVSDYPHPRVDGQLRGQPRVPVSAWLQTRPDALAAKLTVPRAPPTIAAA